MSAYVRSSKNLKDLKDEEGSYLRLIDLCITQLEAQGSSRTCNESKEEEEEEKETPMVQRAPVARERGGILQVLQVLRAPNIGGHRIFFCREAMLPFGSHQAPLSFL